MDRVLDGSSCGGKGVVGGNKSVKSPDSAPLVHWAATRESPTRDAVPPNEFARDRVLHIAEIDSTQIN